MHTTTLLRLSPIVSLALLTGCASSSGTATGADARTLTDLTAAFMSLSSDTSIAEMMIIEETAMDEGFWVNAERRDASLENDSYTNLDFFNDLRTTGDATWTFEAISPISVEVWDDVAVSSTRYRTTYEQRGHEGTVVFTWVRTPEGWRNTGGVYEMRMPEG